MAHTRSSPYTIPLLVRFLGDHNDHEAVTVWQQGAALPDEQPSIRQAAKEALAAVIQGQQSVVETMPSHLVMTRHRAVS